LLFLGVLAVLAHAARAQQGVWRGHGLAMHGDLKYGPAFEHFDYVRPDAPRGGELRLGTAPGGFDSFHPFVPKGDPAGGLLPLGQSYLYDPLMVQSADEPFSMYGLLAETVETPADRSWVAFTLREGARWHDGRPITPEDVIWTFRTLTEKGAPLYRFYFANVTAVEKAGPRKVLFTFRPGENRELPLILGQFPILPRHYWEGRDFEKTTLEPPLGSGAYRIGRFEANRFVVFDRVVDYWARDLPANAGRFNFDRIRIDYYRDEDVAIEALKGGEFDFRLENNSKKWATAYEIPDVASGRLVKQMIPHQRTEGMQGFAFNERRSMFQDPRVRSALAYAFDFEWSNRTLFYGQYTRTRSYFDNSELAARGLPGPAEQEILAPYRGRVPDEVFTRAYEPPTTDGSGNLRANLKRATDLLAAAGWTLVDGVLTRGGTGEKLEFEVLLQSSAFERIVLPFIKNLGRIGVKATVRTVDQAQYIERVRSFDFDVIVGRWAQSDSPGNEQRDFWGSEAATRDGSRNWIGIRDPVVDELIETLIAAPDREALVARVRALDRVLQWGHHVIPHYHISGERLLHWDRFGMPEVTPAAGVQVDTWWIDPARDARLGLKRGGGA
jgi:microcin C transport system substrate-binding protein